MLRPRRFGTYGAMGKRKTTPKAKDPGPVTRGDRIREIREARGWSQNELAYRAQVWAADISAVECGHRDMRAPNLRRLCLALNVSADYLLGLSDHQAPRA